MQYSFLIYFDESQFKSLPKDEQNRVHRACGDWHEELVRHGQSRAATGLQSATTARTVREKQGKILVTDGPFAETKEMLGGIEAVTCRDLDEALAIAKRFPGLAAGCSIEIRPEVQGNVCEA